MIFTSVTFLFLFLPIVFLIYFISRDSVRNVVLLLASLFFYAWGEPIYVLIMLASIAVNYVAGLIIGGFHKKWADCDTENQDKFVRLNLSDGTYLDYLANSYYSNIGDYFENNKYDYARFSLAVPIEQIGDEIKSLQIIFSENGKYYASKQIECVIE